MTVRTFDALAREILAAPPRLGESRLVTIDGPSGSGKTTFARRLVRALAALGSVSFVEIEMLYQGWTLDGAWTRLHDWVLEPVATGWAGGFHPYDWANASWSPSWCAVPVSTVLVVEGCGSSPRAAQRLSCHQVWVQAPPDVNLARSLARDGPGQQEQLRAWRRLEATYFVAEGCRERADLRVEGDPGQPLDYDPESAFRVMS